MTKYQCHGCGRVYDDEEGMPGECCGKVLRHIYYDERDDNCVEEVA